LIDLSDMTSVTEIPHRK